MDTNRLNQKEEQRRFILIDTLPEDFLTISDFNLNEEIILELDFWFY